MADQTRSEAAVMAQTANKFRSTNQDLNGMLTRLMGELDGLRAGWRGRGAQAFDNARLNWDQDMKQLHQALEETANAIDKAGTYYTTSDSESANRLNAFQGGSNITLPL
ncbi:WXG100 family type VII secretion target [Planosporangium sp. 12N6]|uniref:WXG100 family type VII secretion target n=1 Tax=Planosporangium spinosum TaxID=3402278 RepID=UPI003CEB78D5